MLVPHPNVLAFAIDVPVVCAFVRTAQDLPTPEFAMCSTAKELFRWDEGGTLVSREPFCTS